MILYTSIILDAAKTMVYLGICFLGKFPDFVLAFDELKMWAYTHGYLFYKNIRLKARIAIFQPSLPPLRKFFGYYECPLIIFPFQTAIISL